MSEPTLAHAEIIDRIRALAKERFAPRAARYDAEATFPTEDFDDLAAEGLLMAAAPTEYGGLGLSPLHGTAHTLWMTTKEIAKVDLSLARCWEGHCNSMVLLDGIADAEQKERWYRGVREDQEIWVAWSGEPQKPRPGQKRAIGTTLERSDGGWIVDGSKVFATSATGARRAILLVSPDGPGGARHATSTDHLLLLVCDLKDPSVSIDGSWWDPIGMRATVSHRVQFDRTFVADADVLGRPGQYLGEEWQTRFIPHYASSFLGAAEGAYEYALEYVTTQDRREDPYVQHRIGRMSLAIETAHLWLRRVADLWAGGDDREAQRAGNSTRFLVEELATETLQDCIHACGARCLVKPSPVERIYRDLSLYMRHDNADSILATIGRSAMGLEHDGSFYRAKAP